ncbi:MAG: T9SS type A sorting domain-containing protein [Bacteroidota bacterium]
MITFVNTIKSICLVCLVLVPFAGISQTCFFTENFETASQPGLPAGWMTENPSGDPSFISGDNQDANAGGFWPVTAHTQFAFANDDLCNCNMSTVRLILPVQDFSGYAGVTINAQVWLDNFYGPEVGRIEVSTDGGFTWTQVGDNFEPLEAWQSISVDLSAYDGMSNVLVALRYSDNAIWGRGMAVDDVCLFGLDEADCLFTEDFENGNPPQLPNNWVTTNINGGFVFEIGDSTAANSGEFWPITDHGIFAYANDDACNCNMSEVRLILPPQDFSGYTAINIFAEYWIDNVYSQGNNEVGRVEVSLTNGLSWIPVGENFPPAEAWQPVRRDLSEFAGLSNVLVAIRYDDRGNWGRGLAIDDVRICGTTDQIDVAITETHRIDPSYTIVPINHVSGAEFKVEVENLGTTDLTNLVLSSRLYDIASPLNTLAVLTSLPQSLPSGGSAILDSNPLGLAIAIIGNWQIEHSITHDAASFEVLQDDNIAFTSVFQVSDFEYARDDVQSVDLGGFGVGPAMGDNAIIGQTFEWRNNDLLEGVEVVLDNPVQGTDVTVALFACQPNGKPMGQAIALTETQVALGNVGDETFFLEFDNLLSLPAGIYFFGLLEPGPEIGIKAWSRLYTDPSGGSLGTNWVYSDDLSDWTEGSSYSLTFAVAYAIRPRLAPPPCSPGDVVTDGTPEVVCGNDETFILSTGSSETIPQGGGYGWSFIPGPNASGGVLSGFTINFANPTQVWNSDLNGTLSSSGLDALAGTWLIQGFTYRDPNSIPTTLCGFTPSFLVVNFSPDISAEGTFSPPSPGMSDGAIDLEPEGGIPPYTFLWSNGLSTEDITDLAEGIYGVTITDTNDCHADFDFGLTTGVEDMLGLELLEVFPNPAIDELNLQFRFNEIKEISIEIISSAGQVITSFFLGKLMDHTIQIPISSLPSGNYLIKISTDNQSFTTIFSKIQ